MKLSFIGAGKMATAICKGLVEGGVFRQDEMMASDILLDVGNRFTETTGVACNHNDNFEIVHASGAVVLAVKPQVTEEVLAPLTGLFDNKLLISIVAGLSITKLSRWIASNRIIRVMPNTPVVVGRGATVFTCSRTATRADKDLVKRMFESAGIALEMREEKLDAVTGFSGSGPAYVFEFIQAMLDGANGVGLDPNVSLELGLETIAGATEMVRAKLGSPEELRNAVTSPGGTTQAGLAVLNSANFRQIIQNAIKAATQRSIELGDE